MDKYKEPFPKFMKYLLIQSTENMSSLLHDNRSTLYENAGFVAVLNINRKEDRIVIANPIDPNNQKYPIPPMQCSLEYFNTIVTVHLEMDIYLN